MPDAATARLTALKVYQPRLAHYWYRATWDGHRSLQTATKISTCARWCCRRFKERLLLWFRLCPLPATMSTTDNDDFSLKPRLIENLTSGYTFWAVPGLCSCALFVLSKRAQAQALISVACRRVFGICAPVLSIRVSGKMQKVVVISNETH